MDTIPRPRGTPSLPVLRMPTATTRVHPRRSTTSNGARITTSHCRRVRSVMSRAGGPVTLPDPNILANGPWYGGSPYLGPDATVARRRPHRHHAAVRHGRESARFRSWLCLHVALAQRARDHDQQYFPGRNDDDDARRFPGIRHRRVELGTGEEQCDPTSQGDPRQLRNRWLSLFSCWERRVVRPDSRSI